MRSKTTINLLFALFISGCSLPYQSIQKDDAKRYRNIEGDKYEVTYYGDDLMDEEKIQDYCLLSCAEVAEILDYSYFKVEKKTKVTRRASEKYFDGGKSQRAEYVPVSDENDLTFPYYSPPQLDVHLTYIGYKYLILCSRELPEDEWPKNVYVAKDISEELCRKYDIQKGEPVAGGDATRWRE